VVIGGTILIIISVILGLMSNFLITIIGFVYPAYMSFKALESKDVADDTQWLTYWIIFSLFRIVDGFGNFVLQYVPFYYTIKLVFLVYLYHPRFRGATLVYQYAIRPFMLRHQAKIDEKLEQLANNVKENVVGE